MADETPQTPPPAPEKPLSELIETGIKHGPMFGVLYGPPGIGKTRFVSRWPKKTVLLATEDGANQRKEARRIPVQTWEETLAMCKRFANEPHDYTALAIDTWTALESMLHDHICRVEKVSELAKIPYGDGYKMAREKMTKFFGRLSAALCAGRGMDVWVVGHATVKTIKEPSEHDYACWVPDGNTKTVDVALRCATATLLMRYKTKLSTGGNPGAAREISVGKRILVTNRSEGIEAKNRYELPDEVDAESPDELYKLMLPWKYQDGRAP